MNNDTSSKKSLISRLKQLSNFLLHEPTNQGQLVKLLHKAQHRALLNADALKMIEGVLHISNQQVRDIMVPRSQMVIIEADKSLKEYLPIVIESGHSRFPVLGEKQDEIKGILLAKDLLKITVYKKQFNFSDFLRPAVFIPESKRLDVLLKEFRLNRNHMAIVVDEYASIAGLVTIEDVLEEIVGEIEDEHDVDETTYITEVGNNRFVVKALMPIEEFNQFFKSILNDEEFDTIGGLVMNKFSHLPKRNETIDIDKFHFKVLHADKRRIRLLSVQLKP